MTDLKTDQSLLEALRLAVAEQPSAVEIEQQRISFILGSLRGDSTVSREKISQVLADHEGKKQDK
jgi:hypothetical protein